MTKKKRTEIPSADGTERIIGGDLYRRGQKKVLVLVLERERGGGGEATEAERKRAIILPTN